MLSHLAESRRLLYVTANCRLRDALAHFQRPSGSLFVHFCHFGRSDLSQKPVKTTIPHAMCAYLGILSRLVVAFWMHVHGPP